MGLAQGLRASSPLARLSALRRAWTPPHGFPLTALHTEDTQGPGLGQKRAVWESANWETRSFVSRSKCHTVRIGASCPAIPF